jgi:2-oxoisovalerate dehydrogenase E1 component
MADPSNGDARCRHWGHRALNIVPGSSATATQVLHAVGGAEAGMIYERVGAIPDRESRFQGDEVVYVSLGEGATSEGEFWESLNTTCSKRLPVLFLIEDNGYAISVPVEVQTPGGDISRLLTSFPGLHVASVDGTDFFASLRVVREAVAYVRARKGPAVVHARADPAVFAFCQTTRSCTSRRRARGRGAPGSDHAVRRVPAPQRAGDRRRDRRDSPRSAAGSRRGRD